MSDRLDEKCQALANSTLAYLIENSEIEQVILAARWESHIKAISSDQSIAALRAVIEKLGTHGKTVVLLSQVPDIGSAADICNFNLSGLVQSCKIDRREAELAQGQQRSVLLNIADDYEFVGLFDPYDTLCDQDRCALHHDGQFLYYDHNHIYGNASRLIAEDLFPFLGA